MRGWIKNFIVSLMSWAEYYWTLSVIVFVNMIQTRVSWEEDTPVKEEPPSYWPVACFRGHFLNC